MNGQFSVSFATTALTRPVFTMPAGAQTIATILFGFIAFLILVRAVHVARREHTSVLIWLYIGSILATPFETFDCYLGHCVYPQIGQWQAYHFFDMQLPWFLVFLYPVYLGALVLWIFERLRTGKLDVRLWWKIVIGTILAAAAFEPPAIHLGLWHYYGKNQPTEVLGLPFWWEFANAIGVLGVGVVCFGIWDHLLNRKHPALMAVLVPFALFAIHTPISMPAYIALNTFDSAEIGDLGACITALLSLMVAWLFARYIGKCEARMTA